jgi:hypothetical protein
MRSDTLKHTSSRKQIGAYIMTSERYTIHALEYDKDSWHSVLVSCAVMRGLSRPSHAAQVLPFYWPYEKSLQSAVLQSLRSAEHGLGRGSFGTQNLRVTNQTESDGHVTVSAATNETAGRCTMLVCMSILSLRLQLCYLSGHHRGWYPGIQASGGSS